MSLPNLMSQYADTFPELVRDATPAPTPHPEIVLLNRGLATELGLDAEWLATDDGINFLLGHTLPDTARPVAQAYAGHQFGNYVPTLGDGRAILTGELRVDDGLVDIHLKGTGPTPFSRPGSDGFAALGPMLREYLVSEAVHALGIPTSRALAVVSTGATIQREMEQPAAVLVRTGPSHIRVGTFQYVRARQNLGLLQRITNYSLQRHYPAVETDNPALALLEEVVTSQAELLAQWMHVGLIHGVMNTDNMTVAGHSIDFGPVAFLDKFDPQAVFSSIDFAGRYAYGNQPLIAEWNLARFAESVLPAMMHPADELVMSQDEAVTAATEAVTSFSTIYSQAWAEQFTQRLGLSSNDDTKALGSQLFEYLQNSGTDFTAFFAGLPDIAKSGLIPAVVSPELMSWYRQWLDLTPDTSRMAGQNPIYVPRNHLVEEAIQDAVTDQNFETFHTLLAAVTNPYERQQGFEHLEQPAPMAFAMNYQTFCGT